MKIEILHKDSDIVVAVKPCGVPSQQDKTNSESMDSMLKLRLYEEESLSGEPYLVPIHRLDRPVGGVMVFARNQAAAAELSRQSEEQAMEKYYQAIVTGELPDDCGTLTDYLLHDAQTNVTRIVTEDTPGAKYAELEYEVLDVMDTDEGVLSYILVKLVTGRHHQIRAQLAGRKCGIWGDTKYNPKFMRTKKKYKEIGLHASRLEFDHPTTGEHMVFKHEPEGGAFDVLDLEEF